MHDWEHDLIGAVIFLQVLIGFAINGFILYSSYLKFKTTRQTLNLLVINIAIANLGMIIFALPLSLIASFKHTWIWGDFGCVYYGSVALFFGYAVMINVLMLCMDIFFENSYNTYEYVKSKIRKFMILWIWSNSLFWSVAPLLGWSKISYEPSALSCSLDVMHPDVLYKSYIVSSFVWFFAIPIGIMIYCRIKQKEEYYLISEERKSYQKLFILLVLFFIEWTPYCIVYLWPLFDDPKNIPIRLSAVAPVFAKLCVVLNPLVYLKEY